MEQSEAKRGEVISKFSLDDRVAVVTGGGGGIGKGIALGLAAAGAHIVIPELNASKAESTAAEVRALGRKALPIIGDISKSEQISTIVDRTLAEFGKIDILVNNIGGLLGRRARLLDMPEEFWDIILDLNLRNTFLCSKIIGRVMAAQKKGNIINISSAAGLRPHPGQPAYGAAKAGVISLTESLAVLFAPYHIRVNCIAPTATGTPGYRFSLGAEDPDERARKKGVPLGRAGRPEDYGFAAIFLASDAADFITGVTIPVTGGPLMGRQLLEEAEADWKSDEIRSKLKKPGQ